MGPRSGERGNQCSADSRELKYSASMGPRSGERGNDESAQRDGALETASMGPRSGERGNLATFFAGAIHDTLQWGRAQVSAEIGDSAVHRGQSGSCFNGAALR